MYDREIRSTAEAEHRSEYAAIDIETGVYETDPDDFTATEKLLARQPNAQIWLVRIGCAATYRVGGPRVATK